MLSGAELALITQASGARTAHLEYSYMPCTYLRASSDAVHTTRSYMLTHTP